VSQSGDSDLRAMEQRLREMLGKSGLFAAAAAREPQAADPAPSVERLQRIRGFNLKPRHVSAFLDRFVVGQVDAKQALSVAVCDHYNHVRRCIEDPADRQREYVKPNILLLGPTGVGKTYLVRCLARLIGVPFVKADATKFSETGYVGRDAEDLVRDLVKAADGDIAMAEYGIIYLDEVDKIAAQPSAAGRDVSGRGVQINLLKLMEDTDVSPYSQTDIVGQVQAIMDLQRGRESGRRNINTRHILFIASGAFVTLAEAVERRLYAGKIGFEARPGARSGREGSDMLRKAATQDFVTYGFEPEFIGRLPTRVVCDPLAAGDLERILKQSEGSVLEQYKADFRGYGIELVVEDAAIAEIAARAHAEGTGARGLLTVIERVLRGFKYELPSTSVKTLTVSAETVADPAGALQNLLQVPPHPPATEYAGGREAFCREFERASGIALTFPPAACEAFAEACRLAGVSGEEFCRTHFADFEHAFKLAARQTGKRAFRVSAAMVRNPKRELARLVARCFAEAEGGGTP
jgi:endopeptidase Clp ATP-binding regulatory subunit ClpX